MADAEQILVLGHRGLLGQALVAACQGRCQVITGGREGFDLAVARGVASLPALLELTLPFIRVGGALVAQKGRRAGEEVAEAGRAIELLGGSLWGVRQLGPDGQALVVIDKVRATPETYPRRSGVPQRRPL